MFRVRGLGWAAAAMIFILMLSTNIMWLSKSVAERKAREANIKLEDVQTQLAAQLEKTKALEQKLSSHAASLPPTSPPSTSSTSTITTTTTTSSSSSSSSSSNQPSKSKPAPEDKGKSTKEYAPRSQSQHGPDDDRGQAPAPLPDAARDDHVVADDAVDAGSGGASESVHARKTGKKVPVLVMACCRPGYLEKTLNTLSQRMPKGGGFELVVSQDGIHEGVAALMRDKFPQVKFMQHVDNSPIKKKSGAWEQDSYYKIARHYGWALGKVFEGGVAEWVIVLEDDLEVAPDFFGYMAAGAEMMERDHSLWTVTAWNDNGLPHLAKDSKAVYRSDFFAGLGWIMSRRLWEELGPKWPVAYWDDWMREPQQRKGRACLRPEVSRTVTFGKEGSSNGQFFASHLSKMRLNSDPVDFERRDMSYLVKKEYDAAFREKVSRAKLTGDGVDCNGDCKLTYRDYDDFKRKAQKLGIMEDEKAGVPRTAYLGVVQVRSKAGGNLYVAPERGRELYQQG